MIDALHISESGMKATQRWIDAISNNVANIQTAGYKKTAVHFTNLVRHAQDAEGTPETPAIQELAGIGLGTRLTSSTVFSEGALQPTNNPLDLAIDGAGFIEVVRPDGGVAYSRLGRLRVTNDGQLANFDGLVLSDDIRVPPDVDELEIGADGTVRGHVAGSQDVLELGQIHIARIGQPDAMTTLGEGLYTVNDASGEATMVAPGTEGTGTLLQGRLEMSNVDLVEEMTSLVLAQRAYQLNARIVQTADQVMETINNLRR